MFDLGSLIRFTHAFTDSDGNTADPSAVAVTFQLPDLSTASGSAVKDSTGNYHADYTPAAAGHYSIRWVPTGGGSAYSDSFNVSAAYASTLVSLDDFKTLLSMDDDPSDVSSDPLLRATLRAASAVIDSLCGYSAPTTVTEYVSASNGGSDSIALTHRPVMTVTSVSPQTNWAPTPDVTVFSIDTVSGVVTQTNGMRFYGRLKVVYVAGRGVVPESMQEACLLVARNLWELQRGGGTVVPNMASDDIETDPRWGLAITPRVRELVYAELLGPNV